MIGMAYMIFGEKKTYHFLVAVEYDPTNEHRFVCCMYRNVFEFVSINSEASLNIVDELDSMLDHHQTKYYAGIKTFTNKISILKLFNWGNLRGTIKIISFTFGFS